MDPNVQPSNDEITFGDLSLKLKEFYLEVKRYWYIPAVCGLIGMAILAYSYFQFVPEYPAEITFSVDEDEGGSSSGLTGILGQFGIGSVRPTRYNLDKIMALSKSRRVIQNTLFAKITIDGNEDFLANHILREYELNVKEKRAAPFLFTHDSVPIFSRDENEMMIAVYAFIIGPPEKPKEALVNAE